MKYMTLPLAAAIALILTGTPARATPVLGSDLLGLTVFADTYISAGANSLVLGNMLSGDVLSVGDSAFVTGNITSVGASNIGGGVARLGGNMISGGVATVGAGAAVDGNITAGGAASVGANAKLNGGIVAGGIVSTGATVAIAGSIKSGEYASIGANSTISGDVAGVITGAAGAGSSIGSQSTLTSPPVDAAMLRSALISSVQSSSFQVTNAQQGYSALGRGTALITTMTVNTILYGGGVFSAPNFSTTAGIILTLDDQGIRQDWVFNITDYLVTGGSSIVEMANSNKDSTLTWNVDNGYTTLGANSVFTGTILSKTYISVGANASVSGFNNSCGIFSATSYVVTGAGSSVGSLGCGDIPSVVPEPSTYALLLVGLASMMFMSRRKIFRT